jgi:predicted acetyltransferase/ribosomal protein S18 acetylase RimI-like enzyme
MLSLSLRPVAQADRSYMEVVYFDTQRWIIERLFGWRGDDVERAKFAEFYDERNSSIVVLNGDDIGWVTLVRQSDCFELEGIYIVARHQGKGYGTALINRFSAEAETERLPVHLSTAKINPALDLYRRLGFAEVREDEYKVYMERPVPDLTKFSIQRLSHELVPSFVRMRDAFTAAGEDEWTFRGEEIAHGDPHAYVDLMNERSKGREIAEDFVRADSFWIFDDGEIVGELSVRHVLTDALKKIGGHIGYATHPGHRGCGVATFALNRGLSVLKHLGVEEALITCQAENLASIRVIEKCGGQRIEDSEIPGRPDLTRRRYIIPLV